MGFCRFPLPHKELYSFSPFMQLYTSLKWIYHFSYARSKVATVAFKMLNYLRFAYDYYIFSILILFCVYSDDTNEIIIKSREIFFHYNCKIVDDPFEITVHRSLNNSVLLWITNFYLHFFLFGVFIRLHVVSYIVNHTRLTLINIVFVACLSHVLWGLKLILLIEMTFVMFYCCVG